MSAIVKIIDKNEQYIDVVKKKLEAKYSQTFSRTEVINRIINEHKKLTGIV